MSFSMFILLVDKGTPFNIHIVVGLISPYFIVERVTQQPNKSAFQADINVLQFWIWIVASVLLENLSYIYMK